MATGSTGSGPTGTAPTGATGAGPTGATGATDPRLKAFKAPEKYANEPWAREVKNAEDLWTKMAGAQKLLGKDKVTIPGENATAEELNAFHVRMGRPENPEGYEFKNIADLKDVERNVTLDHGMKKILHEEGVSKAVGERIIAKSEALIHEMHKPVIKQAVERNMAFEKKAVEIHGSTEERDASITATQEVLQATLGADAAKLAPLLGEMDNPSLLYLTTFGKLIHNKYAGENRIGVKPGDKPGLSGDLKADFQTLSAQKVTIKSDEKMPEHIKKMKIANLNLQMQKIGVKAREKDIDLFAT